MDGRWTQIRKLFREALDLEPAEWERFLQSNCPDVQMQEKILSMLAAYDEDDTFLERPAAEVGPGAQERNTSTQLVGTRVGPYEIKRSIARGGMGVVFEALDTRLDKVVALKMMSPALVQDPSFRQRFEQEARTLAKLEDPHFVRINALIDEGPNTFIVMEYVDGVTLAQHIRQRGPLAGKDALAVGLQLLQALSKAHRQGIIHRDLKPSNIMLTKNYEGRLLVKVLDFGIAKNILPDGNQTRTVGAVGTLFYMSPEQARGLPSIDHRTDLYSLGVTLYEAVSGDMPFDAAADEYTIRRQIVEGNVIPLNKRLPKAEPALVSVLTKALKTDPAERYADAEDMRQAMLDALTEIRTATDVKSSSAVPSQIQKQSAGKKKPVMLLASIAVVAVFLSAAFIYNQFNAVETEPIATALIDAGRDSLEVRQPGFVSLPEGAKADSSTRTDSESLLVAGSTETATASYDTPPPQKPPAGSEVEPAPVDSASQLTPGPEVTGDALDATADSAVTIDTPGNEVPVEPPAPVLAGVISIMVDPPSRIYVDEELQEDTIVHSDTLITGKHLIRVKNNVLGEWACEIPVEVGPKKDITIFLEHTIPITVYAEDVDTNDPIPQQPIYLDGEVTAYTTPETFSLSAGLHKISLVMQGYTHVESVLENGAGCFQQVGDSINVDPESVKGSRNRPIVAVRMKKVN